MRLRNLSREIYNMFNTLFPKPISEEEHQKNLEEIRYNLVSGYLHRNYMTQEDVNRLKARALEIQF